MLKQIKIKSLIFKQWNSILNEMNNIASTLFIHGIYGILNSVE